MKKAVCLVLPQDGKFLAISRRNDFTHWGIPGGKVDPFETNAQACKREVQEELGLTIELIDLEPLWVGFCPEKLAPPVDYWVTSYLHVPKAPIDLDKLVPELGFRLQWMTRDELENPALSPFADYNVNVFKAYDIYANR